MHSLHVMLTSSQEKDGIAVRLHLLIWYKVLLGVPVARLLWGAIIFEILNRID